jgi:hypothetical protein
MSDEIDKLIEKAIKRPRTWSMALMDETQEYFGLDDLRAVAEAARRDAIEEASRHFAVLEDDMGGLSYFREWINGSLRAVAEED